MSPRIVIAIVSGLAAGFVADRLLNTEWRAATLLAIAVIWIVYMVRSHQRRNSR
jgi:Flp pilus assembly protein TadB